MINYIVLGHKNPRQIKRLIGKLYTDEFFFYVYIHIDSNTDIGSIKQELSGFDNLLFLEGKKRHPGIWGDLGIVLATIEVLKQIIADGRNGYCVLLSGQDYPIKDKVYIENFFRQNYGTNYISVFPLPADCWLNSAQRINYYKINKSSKRGDFALLPSVFQKEFYTAGTIVLIKELLIARKFSFVFKVFRKRKFPQYLKPYGGDQWWALPIETVKKIIEFIDNNPDYLNYHKYSLLPDEMFFHSIFMSFNKDRKLLMRQPSVTYVNWSRPERSLPVTFTENDFEELSTLPGDKLFARKFDIDKDQLILDLLDRKTAEKIV